MASNGCRAACLNTAGRGGIFKTGETSNIIQAARIRKTKMFFENREAFMALLVNDVKRGIIQAKKRGYIPAFRLNGTSDIVWESVAVDGYANLMEMFPNVQFYDYTKRENRAALPTNYHLTLSRSETNEARVMALPHNVAVVFAGNLPAMYQGRAVVSGDDTDLRFLDDAHVVVGLTAKGRAKKDASGFVVTA
jgi:hypothetical protein